MLHMVYHPIHLSKPHIKLRIVSAIEKKKTPLQSSAHAFTTRSWRHRLGKVLEPEANLLAIG